jgi:hypothetical protein
MPDDEVEAAISVIRARCPELTSSIFDMIAAARSPATSCRLQRSRTCWSYSTALATEPPDLAHFKH